MRTKLITPSTKTEPHKPLSSDVDARLRRKLDPGRFPRMSGKMAAVVAYLLGAAEWVSPPIKELIVTSDRFVLGRIGDQLGFDTFFGAYSDLMRNWHSLLVVAGLSTDELCEAECRFAGRIGFYGRPIA